jgi:L-lactate dehydrogenase
MQEFRSLRPGKIFEEVKDAAYKIIELKGATYYAIALALVRITEVVLRDENSVLPVSSLIDDYYGINDVCLSLPCKVNKNGIEQYLRIELSDEEKKKFIHSAQTMKDIINSMQL